jgi:uncharacterized protein (TIGR02246 family)
MHMKTFNAMSVAVALVIAASCADKSASGDGTKAAQQGGPTNDPATRQAIDSMDQKFSAAFKSGDATTAASFYEDNATSMPPNMEAETGKAAIEKGYTELFKSIGKVSDFTAQAKDVDIYGDHAIEIGSYAMTFTPAGAKEPVKDHGSYVNYWRKQADGSWKIHRDAIVSANPMPNMGPPPAPAKKK